MCRWRKEGAEFLFQVIAERAEKAAVLLTTNLPFDPYPIAAFQEGMTRKFGR